MIRFFTVIFFLFFFLYGFSQERNFQLWKYSSIDVMLSDNLSIGSSGKIHYTPKKNSLDLKFADITIEYNVNHWFEVGGGGRMLWIKKEYGWLQEKRPMLYGTISFQLSRFEFDFSNRVEYRFFDRADNHFRHRQKLNLDFPKITNTELQFFTAVESFYIFNAEKIHLARLITGLNTIQNKHFDLQIYYVLQKSKELMEWSTTDIVGISMNFDL